jgi:hypothetical protein
MNRPVARRIYDNEEIGLTSWCESDATCPSLQMTRNGLIPPPNSSLEPTVRRVTSERSRTSSERRPVAQRSTRCTDRYLRGT